jgi:hypothetical protein
MSRTTENIKAAIMELEAILHYQLIEAHASSTNTALDMYARFVSRNAQSFSLREVARPLRASSMDVIVAL